MDTPDQIKNHIAKGESYKAVKLLLEYTKEERPGLYDEALLLSGQYRQWKRRLALGVEQSGGELRRIEVGVMDVLNDEETYDGTSSRGINIASTARVTTATAAAPKSNLTSILLGVFGTISVIFVIALMFPVDYPAIAENVNTSSANITTAPVSAPEKQPEKTVQLEATVFGGGLTESQFDNSMSSLQQSTGTQDPARFDISTVIQVRYTTGEREGFFESVAGTNEWIERGIEVDDIRARYKEVDRKDRTITLKDMKHDRRRFLSIDEDKVYEQVETFPKFHVFNIIGVY